MVRPETISQLSGRRRQIADFVEHPRFVLAITVLIIINAVTLGLETDAGLMARVGGLIGALDTLILLVFTVEVGLKLYAYRLQFFRSPWNVFDFLIVAVAWLPSSGGLSILRALRILRAARLMSVVPQMRRVIGAIGHSLPGMVSVIGVLALVFYISSVLTTKLFGGHPDPEMREWFGTIWASAYTLFQVMTLESWSMGIVRPVMEVYPYAWLLFVPYIMVVTFAVLNLFIGIVVDAMQQQNDAQTDAVIEVTQKEYHHLLTEIKSLRAEVRSMNGDSARSTPPDGSSGETRS